MRIRFVSRNSRAALALSLAFATVAFSFTALTTVAFTIMAFANRATAAQTNTKDPAVKAPDPQKAAAAQERATAVFAGGCFWCMEPPFEKLAGVISVESGYTGGKKDNPTYEEVSAGGTGHYESVQVTYDPKKISYRDLLKTYWKQIDPFDADGQFCDKGASYRAAIFVANEAEKAAAEQSLAEAKAALAKRKQTGEIKTQIVQASKFFRAEAYHQDYYKENPIRYKFYRGRCGRDERLMEVWGQ